MSQGKSIFSSPSSSNGEAPVNPFAGLGNGKAGSPFAAAPAPAEAGSPFGFADEQAPEKEARLPDKRQPEIEKSIPVLESNPFSSGAPASATPAPQAEAKPTPQTEAIPQSPFAPSVGFEAPSAEESVKEEKAAAPANPLTASTPQEAAAPAAAAPQAAAAVPAAAQPQAAATPAAAVPVAAAATVASFSPTPAAAAPAATSGGHSTRQLELRAIFGVEGEMSREEMLQRAKSLPGIREVAVVGASEMAAIQTLGGVMSRFGYAEQGAWQMTCAGGVIDFISAEGTTLAVMREGRYGAGVWEKLMILAREMGKLG